MEEKHKSLLRTERLYLTNDLQPHVESIVDGLLATDVLNDNMKQEIMEAQQTPVARVRKLLDILPRRGPTAFNSFCTVLLELKEFDVLKRLDPQLAASGQSQVQPSTEGAATANKSTTSKDESRKPRQGSSTPKPAVGGGPKSVPRQVPVPIPNKAVQPSSERQPEQKKAEPKIDRQFSREVQRTEQPSEEAYNDLIDWPEKLDLSLSGVKKLVLEECTQADLKTILSDTEVYDLPASVKGRAVIVKNIIYEEETQLMKRGRADMDTYKLENTLKKLRYRVKQHTDQTAEELIQILKREQEEDHYDAFILVILSYGGVGTVVCRDGKEVPLRDILNVFSNENCPKLKDKPKLFFIQACGTRFNGSGGEKGTSEPDEQKQGGPGIKDATDAMKSLVLSAGDASENILKDFQDMLIVIATHPDETDEKKQYLSLFILAVWTVLNKFSRNHHVLELIDKINSIKKDSSGQAVKLCEFKHSLTKKFYFLPGYMAEHHSTVESHPSLQPDSLSSQSLPPPQLA